MESFESNSISSPVLRSPPDLPVSVAESLADLLVSDVDRRSGTSTVLCEELKRFDLEETGDVDKESDGEEERECGKSEGECENGDFDDRVGNEIDSEKNGERSSRKYQQYPVRPDAEDCTFYVRTNSCKYGSNCKFNHPVVDKNQAVKEKLKEREESTGRPGQAECKYYLKTGGCKFGKACRYNHTRGIYSVNPIMELNFRGLPIRLGEKECPYYMRTGSCKYGANCRFDHPDPTAVGGFDTPSVYVNGGSVSLQNASQSAITSWTSPKMLNETAPFVPMMFPSTPSRSPKWNGYLAPVYLPERSMHPPPAYVMNNPATETNVYTPQQQMSVEEFPERPGQPECSYFLKTGDCKFKSNCKYHHPKNQLPTAPPCVLSDKGLPLRPDQSICSHYSLYGICKFGPSCKFDHPIHLSSTVSGIDRLSSIGNSETSNGARMVGSINGSEVTIQQVV